MKSRCRRYVKLWLGCIYACVLLCLAVPISNSAYSSNKQEIDEIQSQQVTPKLPTNSYSPQPAGALSRKGKQLFEKNHCSSCHSCGISGGTTGGCLGPPLVGIGARRSKEFITARITAEPEEIDKFAKLYGAEELMPHLRLPRAQATSLVAYLLTLPQPPGGFKASGHSDYQSPLDENLKLEQTSQTSIAKGKRMFYDHGCIACHSVYGTGGQFAPCLDGVSKRLTREQIVKRMTQAELLALGPSFEYQERGTVMPPSNLTTPEIQAITDFLETLPARH